MPVLDIFKRKLPNRVVLSVFVLIFSALDLAEPYHQHFSLNNESIQYPFAEHERIPALWAGVIACLFPLVFIIFWTMLIDGLYSHHKPPNSRRRILGNNGVWTMSDRLWEMNCGILGLGLSAAAAIVITGALKNTTGKPRPDLIARCKPTEGASNIPVFGLANYTICTGDKTLLKDGFKSWPSGHSSIAFAGLGYLSLFLAGKLHVFDTRGEVWKTMLVLIPLLAASLIAVSRIMDARHHPFDVITSSIMGFFVAYVAYRQYFPPLSETWKKGRAYPMRSWGTDSAERKRMQLGMYENDPSRGGLVADEEEGGKIGVYNPGMIPVTGGPSVGTPGTVGNGNGSGSRFSDESAAIQARKREAQRIRAGRPRGDFDDYDGYAPQGEHSSGEEPETYELRPGPLKAYRTPGIARTDSQESEDTRWGVGRATTAITGGGAGPPPVPGGFEPVRRTDTGFESVDVGRGTLETKDTPRREKLVDD
ncbi:PAP2-domain-containing protein [Choiromyces venosus 120613-1]|uniref:PAP2-domain-containing protein n=1 Tax=Choiromyces venosus 120613-1 TaxID=1336337 RepID=A0A3N4IUX0_9PEZI|nr:PAP2-domain-containing protein [Choiromyces venosus 120613-1]